MEQIVILILFVLGSIISSIIQNKKKRDELRRAHGPADQDGAPDRPARRRPFEQWPETAADWQEEVRRLLEGEKAPPVISAPPAPPPRETRRQEPPKPRKLQSAPSRPPPIITTIVEEPQQVSPSRKPRVHPSHRRIRAQAVAPVRSPLLQFTRTRHGLRQAFIASLVFSPPVALDTGHRPGT